MINAAPPLSRRAVPWTSRVWLPAWLLLAVARGECLAQSPATLAGDLDGDGLVTVRDLAQVISEVSQPRTLSPALAAQADVNEDGFVNDRDVEEMLDAILGVAPLRQRVPVTFDPITGSSEVGVTVRPKAVFPRAIDIATLNGTNFFATQGGRRLSATIRPAANGSFAWLFFDEPMPNASTIEVVVDGSSILSTRGLALDADADGQPGGYARTRFSTVSVTPLPGTVLHGRVVDPGPDLIPRTADDVVLANGYQYLRPIAGVKVFLHGLEDQAVFTDANGWYRFEAVPVGNVKVVTDGRTATTAHEGFFWPEMVSNARMEPGITNYLMYIRDTNGVITPGPNGFPMPVAALYLPRVMSNVLQTVSTTDVTVITLASNAAYDLPPDQQQHLTLEVPPGSLIGENGQSLATGTVGISVVPPELVREMLPPGLLQHTFDISIQAPGVTTFSTPVPMTFPNVFNAPPGTKLNFLSFDHTTGKLVIEGTATVSEDGLTVRTDPGTGITHPGWHGLTPPGNTARSDIPRSGGSTGSSGGGTGGGGGGGGGGGCCAPPPPPCPNPPCDTPPPIGDPPRPPQPPDPPKKPPVPPNPPDNGRPGSGPGPSFKIRVRFPNSSLTSAQQAVFKTAAKRWERVIIGDLPNLRVSGVGLVDDVVIDARAEDIDGVGGILGSAGPRVLRRGSYLPAYGTMRFDRADIVSLMNSGNFLPTVLHEMGHVLGVGTIWERKGLLAGKGTSNVRFTGRYAAAQYRNIFGNQATSVPVENTGGTGTRDSHWRERVFGRELMTGWLNLGAVNPLSRVTAASMRDLGYLINLNAADFYSASASGFQAAGADELLEFGGEMEDEEPPEEVPALGLHADFGTPTSPVEAFQTQVTATTFYTPQLGHGWLTNPTGGLIDVDRGVLDPDEEDDLIRDYVFTRDATFRVDVPDGMYDVQVVWGDSHGEFRQMRVHAGGDLRASATTRMGQFETNVFRVVVLDGHILLRFEGPDGVAICGMDVDPAAEGRFENPAPAVMSGRFHVAIEDLDSGLVMRSSVTLNPGQWLCPEGVFLAPNTHFREWAFHVDSRQEGISEFTTSVSGEIFTLPAVIFGPREPDAEDTDGDGLTDSAEWVIGTDSTLADTDDDGLSDLIEVQQARNPLGSTVAPTGVIGALPIPGTASEIALWNGGAAGGQMLAALAMGSGGLAIVDVTRPSNPVIIGQAVLAGDAIDVAVDPALTVAVVAAQSGGLHVLNVSDPGQPSLITTLRFPARQVEIIAGVAYFSVGSQVWALDLGSMELFGQLNLGGAVITGLSCEGQFLYTMDASQTLRVIDLANGDLIPRSARALPYGGGKISAGGGVVYVAGPQTGSGGFATVDVSNPAAPVLLSGVDSASIQGGAVAANGSGLAIAVGTVIAPTPGLDVLNISNPSNTAAFLVHFTLPGTPRGVLLAGGIAYVASGEAGLQVVNYRSLDNQRQAPAIALETDFTRLTPTNGHVEGGHFVRMAARVTDDQQVRSVEFYVDGALAVNDLTFPFEYRFLAASLSLFKTNFTLRARALDTGGNATWSEEILVDLDPDHSGPLVRRMTPVPNAIVGTTDRVTAWFNEPLDPASLTTNTFQLFAYGTNGPVAPLFAVAVTNGSLFYRADVSAALLVASSNLAAGLYEARLLPPLADRSSNVLAAPVSWFFQVLDRADRDLDGVPDDVESTLGTDPDSPDSDGDALLDGDEDSDNDGLSNRWEIAAGLDPTRDDTDGNGVKDGAEDPDQDSLSNLREQQAGTLPLNPDSDGDGWNDEAEITGRSLPLNAASTPRLYIVSEPPAALAIPTSLSSAGLGALAFGTVVANPPAALAIPVIPGTDPAAVLSFGSVLANPSAALAIPVIPLDTQRVPLAFGAVIANPPAALAIPIIPAVDPATALSFGSVLANPPAALAVPVVPAPGLINFTNFGSVIAVPPVLIIQTNTP